MTNLESFASCFCCLLRNLRWIIFAQLRTNQFLEQKNGVEFLRPQTVLEGNFVDLEQTSSATTEAPRSAAECHGQRDSNSGSPETWLKLNLTNHNSVDILMQNGKKSRAHFFQPMF